MRVRPAVAGPLSGRGLVLLPVGALVVHQLRYRLTYGSETGSQLGAQGHAYLGTLVPWMVMLAAGGLGWFIARLARAWHVGSDGTSARPLARLWATTGAGLVAIYSLQELLEGLLAEGHPTGFVGIFGHGGWWSVPVAAAVSFAIVALLRVGQTLVQLVARSPRTLRSHRVRNHLPPPLALLLVTGPPLAYTAAGRAPPARSAG
jgi:hypothetical protein